MNPNLKELERAVRQFGPSGQMMKVATRDLAQMFALVHRGEMMEKKCELMEKDLGEIVQRFREGAKLIAEKEKAVDEGGGEDTF